MSDREKPEKIELDEVMFAMDVVDTLRHEQQLVERELASEERDRALFDKIKRIYASQGLEVTDKIIAEGVAALREERFVYQPPQPRGSLWLARLYVNRRRWAKAAGFLAAFLIVVYIVYRFGVLGPEVRRRTETVLNMNTQISRQQDQIRLAEQRLQSLKDALKSATEKAHQSSGVAAKRLLAEAGMQVAEADSGLQALGRLPLKPGIDDKSLAGQIDVVKHRVEQRENLLREVNARLNRAGAVVADFGQLDVLRERLAVQLRNLLAESREDTARHEAEKIYGDALAALDSGEVQGARERSAALQELYGRLVQEYELRIVSEPGTPSGVWRSPQNRAGTRNYYVIVCAVTPQGERLSVPITSEEDGTTSTVQEWGLRVDGALFEKIRRDKLDDGIIQNNRFGVKKRGYLTPQYLMPTIGGAITRW